MAAAGFRCARGIFRHFSSVKANTTTNGNFLWKSNDCFIFMAGNRFHYSLVVGLGNYTMPNTRHSIGMAVVNHLADKLGVQWHYSKKCQGYLALTQIDNQDIVLLKPKLLMNLNGRSVARVVSAYSIQPSDVILIHDELDKPLGKFAIKYGGSAGGHNGVKSSIGNLMSVEMVRLRVGIGRPDDKSKVVDYVLQNFDASEKPVVNYVLEDCSDLILTHLHPASGGEMSSSGPSSSSTTRKKHRKVS